MKYFKQTIAKGETLKSAVVATKLLPMLISGQFRYSPIDIYIYIHAYIYT